MRRAELLLLCLVSWSLRAAYTPPTIASSSLFSGTRIMGIARDNSENVYVAGTTMNVPRSDGMVYVIPAGGTSPPAPAVIGGSGDDEILSIACDNTSLYIVGATTSDDFPTTPGSAVRTKEKGIRVGYIAKLDLSLRVLYATFVSTDSSEAIAVAVGDDRRPLVLVRSSWGSAIRQLDNSGAFIGITTLGDGMTGWDVAMKHNVACAAMTTSDGQTAVAEFGPGQPVSVTRVIGDTRADPPPIFSETFTRRAAIAIGPAGDVWVAGRTSTPSISTLFAGETDIFVTELSADLSQITYRSDFGGSGRDEAHAISVSERGDVYVAGTTLSLDFRDVPKIGAPLPGVVLDVVVIKIAAGSGATVESLSIGGRNSERGFAVTSVRDNVVVAGVTASADFPFPSTGEPGGFVVTVVDSGPPPLRVDPGFYCSGSFDLTGEGFTPQTKFSVLGQRLQTFFVSSQLVEVFALGSSSNPVLVTATNPDGTTSTASLSFCSIQGNHPPGAHLPPRQHGTHH